MSADIYLGTFLFIAAGLLWLGGRGGGPPSKTASLFGLFLALVVGCSSPAGAPFVPPDVGQAAPDVGEGRECYDYDMFFDDYIIGVPRVIRIQYKWATNWCIITRTDFTDFEGGWYFSSWETTFSNWEQINRIVLYVDGRPLAWVTGPGPEFTGFDPTFDVGKYLKFSENTRAKTRDEYPTRICLPVTVDMDAYTALERLEFEYEVTAKVCPEPEWEGGI